MKKRDLRGEWTSRFIHVAMNATSSETWCYTRLSLEEAMKAFKGLSLIWYKLETKEAVYRERVGKGMKKGKCPGVYFRVVRN